jgi:glutamate dehydrogenase
MSRDQEAAMVESLREQILGDLGETVRWFYREMPPFYFQTSDEAEQRRHLETIHALRRAHDARLTLVDDGQSGKLLVFGRPSVHTLLDVMHLVGERAFHRIELHASRDHSLFLYAFCYGPGHVPAGVDLAAHRRAILERVCGADDRCNVQAARYLDAVDQGYLARSTVERVARHILAWSRLNSADDLHIAVDRQVGGVPESRFLAATSGVDPWQLLLHLARIIKRYGIQLVRGYMDTIPAATGGERALIATIYVHGANDKPLGNRLAALVEADLYALRRQYRDALVDLYPQGLYTLGELEVLRAALGFAGQLLDADHRYLDVEDVGDEVVRQHQALCHELCALLAARFQPGRTIARGPWERRRKALAARIHAVEAQSHAAVLEGMLVFIGAVRLTNAFRRDRAGMAFKIAREVLPVERFPQRPYGLFFFSGHQCRGFHVRFRASARGGLRLLLPRNAGAYQRARDGLLKEVYDLAWAQQLKNKDIPEGGSKCIALIEPGGDASGAVKQLVDSLLDLILPAGKVPEVVGPHGEARENDLIFLGPDENMTPERIMWVARRAQERGLPHHPTLMSSKPGSGINHKEYGVTSEGIFRWIDVVLPLVGIAEGQPYTVKMTGGPDGDVAGNLLRILHREHRQRVKVVAISDGTGCAQDSAGLDWGELLRLVTGSLGVARFDPAKLHGGSGVMARVVPASDKAGELVRNTLHNVVAADLFLPCGGRPYTINDGNWQEFLTNGRPSAKAMVEGANIFLTPAARLGLEQAGLVVIKDSSANKGGVICSSYEVLAGLVMSDEEFLAVKPRYVAEVIDLIRARADDEATALLAAWVRRNRQVTLSQLSPQFSDEINRVSGLLEAAITEHLEDSDCQDYWRRHLEAHCPPVLVEQFRARLTTHIPRPHRIAILAKRLASRMVYREGLTWCQSYLRQERLWEVLSTYLKAEAQVRVITAAMSRIEFPDRDTMLRVIVNGSQRELVRERLGRLF